MKPSFIKSITSMLLVITIALGMVSSLGKESLADNKYSITFNGSGGKANYPGYWWHNMSSFTVTPSEDPYPLPEYIFVKTGYKQIGWTTNPSNKTKVEYRTGNKIKRTKDITIYAVYEPLNYAITCQQKVAGTYNTIKTFSAKFNTGILSNSYLPPAPKGYHRWWFDKNTGKQILSSTLVNGNMTIYYEDRPNTCVGTFNPGGNKTPQVKQMKTGQKFYEIYPTPNEKDLLFVGWSTNKDGSDGVYLPTHEYAVEGGYNTFYAQYVTSSEQEKRYTFILSKKDLKAIESELNTTIELAEKNERLAQEGKATAEHIDTIGEVWDSAKSLRDKLFGVAKVGAKKAIVVTCIGLAFSLGVKSTSPGTPPFDLPELRRQLTEVQKALKTLKNDYDTCKMSAKICYKASADGCRWYSLVLEKAK